MTAFFSAIEKHPLIAILRGIKPTEVVDVAEGVEDLVFLIRARVVLKVRKPYRFFK